MATAPPIPGTEEVLSALGWWPSFHDAEVIRFSLSRGATPEEKKSEAQLDVQVREYATRNAGTPQYELAIIRNVVIRFAFTGVQDLQVEDFNFQNVINSLVFHLVSGASESKYRVEIESIYGFGASFLCSDACVEGVSRLATSDA